MIKILKKGIIFVLIICLLVLSIPATSHKIETKSTSEEYNYMSYSQMTNILHNYSLNFSKIMNLSSIGKTYNGKDIWRVKISDNVSEDENEPGILLMGAHHGNEKPSYEVLIYYISFILENYKKNNTDNDEDGEINEDIIDGIDNDGDGEIDEDPSEDRIRQIINNTQLYIIPMVNPDGVEANTRKNCVPNHGWFGYRRKVTSIGVDLNRNYGFNWHMYKIRPILCRFFINGNDKSMTYRGTNPFSENETKAVKQFVEKTNISISLSYHTYASMILYPWFYKGDATSDQETFFSIGENITQVNKYSIYKPRPVGIFKYLGVPGTSEDWLYGEHGIYSFCVELEGNSFAPRNPDLIFDMCWKHIGVNNYVCERSWSLK